MFHTVITASNCKGPTDLLIVTLGIPADIQKSVSTFKIND